MKKNVLLVLLVIFCLSNVVYGQGFVPMEREEEEQVMTAEINSDVDEEIDNTGDLPLEKGAVLWPEMTAEELRDYQETRRQIEELGRNPAYQRALRESERVEEILRRGGTLPDEPLEIRDSFPSAVQPYGASEVYERYCNVPVHKQETYYYCGPATVKQLDDYFNGNRYTQKQIAGYLGTTKQGTDFSRVKQFLRDYVKSGYNIDSIGSFDNWHRIVVNSINNNRPAVLDINAEGIEGMGYNSSGHILNVSGYRFGSVPNVVQVSDPHWKFSGEKKYSADLLYRVNKNHPRQQIIY